MSLRACLIISAAVTAAACTGAPATIEYVETVPARPRLNEIATVKFKLQDYRGVPQAGSMVTFSLQGASDGVTITPLVAMSLKGSGEVTTQVVATTGVNSIVVVANAGSGKIATSPPISFAGTKVPSASQFTFQCGSIAGPASGGIHSLGAFDPERHLIAGVKLDCIAHTGDRNGDGVPEATVSFLTEAGTIGPSETSKTDVVGNAQILYKTSLPLPRDTDPKTFQWNPDTTCEATGDRRELKCSGEYLVPLWMEPNTWTQNPMGTILNGVPAYSASNLQEPRRRDPIRRLANGMQPQNNPRDNLVTMIAITFGEEGFIDQNGDGAFAEGVELFTDTTEPFIDANDNGTWDNDEKFIDTNGNSAWDGKNEKWDANTIIWRQEKIVWTGIPYGALYFGTAPGMGQLDDESMPEPVVKGGQPLAPPIIGCRFPNPPFVNMNLIVADPWFNSLANNSGDDGCEKVASSKNVEVEGRTKGFFFTSPPIRRYGFLVLDNLPREPNPMTMPPSPGCYPPPPATNGSLRQGWSATVSCKFTASPNEGHEVYLIDSVFGEIDHNLPNVQ